ncbi:MAG: hypothetical protein HY847_00990 [Betaproteobacteria bacterium]|nr:hypothetical protein [Betaproteobacteria bacterium]
MQTTEDMTFTHAQLADLSKNFNQLALEALDRGDLEQARHWIKRNEETKHYIHDMYLAWVPKLLSIINERLGEDQVPGILKESVQSFIAPLFEVKRQLLEQGGMRAWMEFMVDVWRQHCGAWTLTEDDEKYTMTQHPCGSGGQMVDRGVYDGILGERKFTKPGFHTFSKENMPQYCGHCVWAHMVLPMQATGEPLWCHDLAMPFPVKPGDPCTHYFFKNGKDIPEKYYAMVGMKKPEAKR